MRSFTFSRLTVSASAIAMATAFAMPAAAAQPTGTQDAQPSTTNTPTPGQQTTPIETVNRTGLPSANQNQTPPGSQPSIVITGSRIKRPEIESPVPVAVIGQQALLQDAAANVSDTIHELPQVAIGNGLTRTNSNFLTSGTGVSNIDLRGLGIQRTLVLVNGRRFVGGFAGTPTVDINNIPTDFIDRIEVVTGGSSAVYGSDAVAGVVNFILKDRFDGIQLRAQGGQTFRGDDSNYLASLTAGQSLFGDRLHLLGNFSWDQDDGLASRNRSISAVDCGFAFFPNPVTGAPEICGPSQFSSFASQGNFFLVGANGAAASRVLTSQFTGNPTNQFTFDDTNALVNGFRADFGFNRDAVRLISVPLKRELATGIANFDITPDIRFFTELTYSHVKSTASIEPLAVGSAGGGGSTPGVVDIQLDNPFIPTDVLNAITAANTAAPGSVTSIGFRRRSNDIFNRSNLADRHTFRAATGFKGTLLGKYNWEVSYVYGRLHDFNRSEDINIANYNAAIDAIRVGPGNVLGVDIVCRDPAARAAGCIPLDIFGHNTADPRAAAFVQEPGGRFEDIVNKQQVATASISGPLFTEWAGDVTAALGTEYRKESTTDKHDLLTIEGLNSGNQLTDLHGQFHVWEAFGELNVPLLKDQSFTKYLGLTGAARYSKYSTVGGVWTYNVGAEWQPIKDLRFRGQYAKAVRAPNISELFSQPNQTFAAVNDPCNGVTATTAGQGGGQFAAACRAIPAIAAAIAANGSFTYTLADLQRIDGLIGGNPNLGPETGKTKTVGAVFTPSFFPGFGLTVDYYDIKISNAISTLPRNFEIQQCLLTGDPAFCSQVIRDPNTGFLLHVNAQNINVASLTNRGVDVGVSYNRALHILPDDRLSVDLKWTHLINNTLQTSSASPPTDFAGTFGRGFSRDSAFLRSSYKFGIVTFGWQTNYLSGGPFFRSFGTTGDPNVDKLNIVHDYWLHDLQLRFDPDKRYTIYFNVDNVFDKKPQLLPGALFGTPTGLETSADMDLFGRRFLAGVRVKFL
jgi:outer membrane receptor protein involved in Fe transport